MINTCREVDIEERVEIVNELMKKMKRSRHSEKVRRMVLECGLLGYYRMVKREEEGGMRVNRPPKLGMEERERKKVLGKVTWTRGKSQEAGGGKIKKNRMMNENREKKGNERIKGIIFVPCTPKGVLVKMMQKAEDRFAKLVGIQRVKMVEKGGENCHKC